jgi:hypothetical protein
MSMHMEGPWLSTTGKKRGKVKWASAEQKRKAEELDTSWKELLKSQGLEQEQRRRRRAMSAEPLAYTLSAPPGRETAHIPSRDTGHSGAVRTKDIPQYTGTKILGIGTMHKSNAVPVFSNEEAHDIATMRRG